VISIYLEEKRIYTNFVLGTFLYYLALARYSQLVTIVF